MSNLPQEITNLLKSARYLHLGTSDKDIPHVSLMNYTFIEKGQATPYESEACIVLTSQPDTQKVQNIIANPNVSVCVHDWVTARSLSDSIEGSLSQVLKNLNQSELSSLSATLTGKARIISGDQEKKFFKDKHAAHNSEAAQCFIGGDVDVILVTIQSAKVADVQNHVQTYKQI